MVFSGSTFIIAVLMGIVGFITTLIWDVNIPKLLSDIILVFILFAPVVFFLNSTSSHDITKLVNFLSGYINTVVNILPEVAVGDVIGSIVAKFAQQIRNKGQH